jgi:hypothetical protein
MNNALNLIKEAKESIEKSELECYERWTKSVAYEIAEHGESRNIAWRDKKTFADMRKYFRHLRRVGFRVTLLNINITCGLYYLEYKVDVVNNIYKDNIYKDNMY